MQWNWQKEGWPYFKWSQDKLAEMEAQFLHQSGILIGVSEHFSTEDKSHLIIELITDEALKTSEIEGEYLDRASIQSSIRQNFGLETQNQRSISAEQGIANLMTDLYRAFDQKLGHKTLYSWHKMIVSGRNDLQDVGCYRTHEEPMQVISGPIHKPIVHFEAPPSNTVKNEMDHFISWFNQTAPTGKKTLPALTKAGIAHLYFVSIHPFEDGNGRIGRAIAGKALSQYLGEPALIALSKTIQANRKDYYSALEKNNKDIDITNWLVYFAHTILTAQTHSLAMIKFLIEKAKLFERARGQLNPRQEKAIERMFKAGLDGFKGGLSAENYISITKTSRATTTRDLQDLVEKNVLLKTGTLKATRYHLNIKSTIKK